jgi:hypothetical protein
MVRDSNPGGMLKTTVSKAAADECTVGVAPGYVEDAFKARTKLAGDFSIRKKTARSCVEHRGCHPNRVTFSNPSVAQG